jgi:hypothetical protein
MNAQLNFLYESLDNIVDSSHVVYDPGHIFDITGIDVPVSLTGEDLIFLVKNYLQEAGVPTNDLPADVYHIGIHEYQPVESNPVCTDRKVNKAGKKVISAFQPEDAGPEYVSQNSVKLNNKVLFKAVVDGVSVDLCDHPEIKSFLEGIGIHVRDSMERHRYTVNMLLSCMLINSMAGKYVRIALSPSSIDYKAKSENSKALGLSFCVVDTFRQALIAHNQAEFIKGYRGVGKYKSGLGSQIRFYDDAELYKLLVELVAKDQVQANLDCAYGVYTSNHKKKTLVDNDKITEETKELFALHQEVAANTTVSIPMDETQDPAITFLPQMTYNDGSKGYDIGATVPMHQIYNRKDMKSGGRYYSSACNMRKDTRRKILLNGKATTEVDIKSCYLAVLATMEGVVLDSKRYEFGTAPAWVNKLLINSTMNCRSYAQARTRIHETLDQAGVDLSVDRWLEEVYIAHPWFLKYIGGFVGNLLAYHESRVMARACADFMARTKSLVLMVHDGVRVESSLASLMASCIIDAWMGYWSVVDQEIAGKNIVVTCLDNTYNGWDRRL